jgi:tetratricopeptide (TPR) repeat protein
MNVQLGDAAFSGGELASAMAYYQQAEQLSPYDEDRKRIAAGIRRVKEMANRISQDRLALPKIQRSIQDFANGIGDARAQPAQPSLTFEDPDATNLPPASGAVDPMVVDSRYMPSSLPKSVEEAVSHMPEGDRVRKGFEAIQAKDWSVALAWFQDALSKQPNDPGLQRLVDLAKFTLDRRLPTSAVTRPGPNVTPTTMPVAPASDQIQSSRPDDNPVAGSAFAALAAPQIAAAARVAALPEKKGLASYAAIEKAARGEGYSKEELDAQFQEAMREALVNYQKQHANLPDPVPIPASAEEISVGGKG